MKRLYSTFAFLIIFLILTTETAFAGSVIDLIGISNSGGGPAFTFRISGDFPQGDLNGTVQVEGGDSFELHCKQVDSATVVCHASKKVSGENVIVYFGGAKFWASVPQPSLGDGSGDGINGYCYEVYSVEFLDRPNFPVGWDPQGQYCQDIPATQGDEIDFYTPSWGTIEPYVFWENGVNVFDWENLGTGYFWNWH